MNLDCISVICARMIICFASSSVILFSGIFNATGFKGLTLLKWAARTDTLCESSSSSPKVSSSLKQPLTSIIEPSFTCFCSSSYSFVDSNTASTAMLLLSAMFSRYDLSMTFSDKEFSSSSSASCSKCWLPLSWA